jgi:serine/threonine protein kinase
MEPEDKTENLGPAVAAESQTLSETGASVLAGRRLGAYQVHELIGAGGMGEVYRARDTKLDRDVAIKILPRLFTSDPGRLARFEREARVLAERLDDGQPAQFSVRFRQLCDPSEPDARGTPGFVGSHSAADVVVREHLEMAFELGLEIAIGGGG